MTVRIGRSIGEGGVPAAFALFLFAAGIFGFGGSLQYPLAVLRVGGFGAALLFLMGRRNEEIPVAGYPLLAGGFVLLAAGHAFSSVYLWISLQHAVNIALAAVLLAWAAALFRNDPERGWNRAFLAIAGIAAVEIAVALVQRVADGEVRPRGTFGDPNFLSEFLATSAVLCLARSAGSDDTGRRRLLWGACAVLFLGASLSFVGSRGVLLAAAPALGLLFVWRLGLRKGLTALALAGVPALAALGWGAAGRFFSADVYNYSRLIIWKSAVRTFLAHPFGVGLGGHKYYWYATQSAVTDAFSRYGKVATTAHNEYLEILSGLGAAGFALFLAVVAAPLFLAARGWRKIPAERKWIAAGATGGLILSGAHAVVNANFHEPGIFLLDAVLLGALLSVLPPPVRPLFRLPRWAALTGTVGLAAAILVSLATVAGVLAYERGQARLREGDLTGAAEAFLLAATVDPLRAPYPDALSALSYRRIREERAGMKDPGRAAASFRDAISWESRARALSPMEPKYVLRLSWLFAERHALFRSPADAESALVLADDALRINPYGVETLRHRAELLVKVGRRTAAIADLERAVSIEPNFCRGYARLAELAGLSDPRAVSAWSAKADECRKRARGLPLEEFEQMLVETPEGR